MVDLIGWTSLIAAVPLILGCLLDGASRLTVLARGRLQIGTTIGSGGRPGGPRSSGSAEVSSTIGTAFLTA